LHLLYEPSALVLRLLCDVETCPRPLRHCRNVSVELATTLHRTLLRDRVLLHMHATIAMLGVIGVIFVRVAAHQMTVQQAASHAHVLIFVVIASGAFTNLAPSSAQSLDALAVSVAKASRRRVLDTLRLRIKPHRQRGGRKQCQPNSGQRISLV
jgi:hypothetical protein